MGHSQNDGGEVSPRDPTGIANEDMFEGGAYFFGPVYVTVCSRLPPSHPLLLCAGNERHPSPRTSSEETTQDDLDRNRTRPARLNPPTTEAKTQIDRSRRYLTFLNFGCPSAICCASRGSTSQTPTRCPPTGQPASRAFFVHNL